MFSIIYIERSETVIVCIFVLLRAILHALVDNTQCQWSVWISSVVIASCGLFIYHYHTHTLKTHYISGVFDC